MVLLIDVDSIYPNLALMKLSSFYKNKGYQITLIKLNISYYPNKKYIKTLQLEQKYFKVFISAIFENTVSYLNLVDNFNNDIIYGGSGININLKLNNDIENCLPDYSIYNEKNISYGFITRGCIRTCDFCFVPKKEGQIYFNTHPKNIIKFKKTRFLDNNILAYVEHKKILNYLVENKIKCQFNQGLDIRLLDQENSILLSKMNYFGDYIFGFDSYSYKNIIDNKLNLLNWRKKWQIKFFIYCNSKMKLYKTINRIEYCRKHNILPYIMRDIDCYNSEFKDFYTDIASYCNQPNLFKKISFKEFLNLRHVNKNRIKESNNLYNLDENY